MTVALKFPFCLIPSPLCFTLLSFFSKFTPCWNPLSSILFLPRFLHSFTTCGYTDALKFWRLLLLLQNYNFTVFNILHWPKKTRLRLLPPVQIQGSRSAPSPWDSGRGYYVPSVRWVLFPLLWSPEAASVSLSNPLPK